jgi:hypothetical protein
VEQRRRTKTIPRFLNEQSCLKLVYATLIRVSERWHRVNMSKYAYSGKTCHLFRLKVYHFISRTFYDFIITKVAVFNRNDLCKFFSWNPHRVRFYRNYELPGRR